MESLRAFFLISFFLILSAPAGAEYRVFLLKIEKRAPAAAPGAPPAEAPPARFEESTLDPEQYRGYHPVADDEIVTYVDTWRCRGRTDHKPLCPKGPVSPPSTAP